VFRSHRLAATFVFIAANLAMGIMFSMIAQNQLQAMQMTFFRLSALPILLSGYLFPFRGMPVWAQAIGEVSSALDPFPENRPGHPAQGKRTLGHRPLCGARLDHRYETLSSDAGLNACISAANFHGVLFGMMPVKKSFDIQGTDYLLG
jgi:hypothetical protein